MAKTPEITRIVFQGEIFSIEFYVRPSGQALAEDWLETVPDSMQVKFAALFSWMGNQGKIANERKFKYLTGSDQIFEFKADEGRILCFFFYGKRIVLTHGFRKKSAKTPKNEIERAEVLKKEFESRTVKP